LTGQEKAVAVKTGRNSPATLAANQHQ